MKARRGEYGFDAPYVPALMLLGSLPLWFGAVRSLMRSELVGFVTMGVSAAFLVFCAGTFIFTTRTGKFRVWDELLAGLSLRGDERVLDVGCGRGAVLLLAAERLTTGKATGIDLWSATDQSGNALQATQQNAAAEGVSERVELHTGDMRKLPFADASFELIVSSLAIHNVPDAAGRAQAVQEIVRVLRPGGRVLLADFKYVADYSKTLKEAGLHEVTTRGLGVRFWYGGPWAATSVVTARR
ncbi:MAG: class I SAM-dependent methyltransferase [Archangium sp.]|nr:class I SAM-dependent methyltransferase [Archangium sp.]MDP3152978.1 class I SAM-dependent methyltransferase [Archangium sp.]MDP3569097.1 class I SAM-dependent methyltransferase [Archangium sp.]